MGVHLIYIYLISVHLMGVYLTGVHLIGVYLIGVYLTGVYLMGVHLIGMYLMSVCLIDVCFKFLKMGCGFGDFRFGPCEPITHRIKPTIIFCNVMTDVLVSKDGTHSSPKKLLVEHADRQPYIVAGRRSSA
jgi:hypothetical protein